MNKLISKNPVLRFKEGRKILFAKVGDKFLYNGEEVVEETLNGQTILRRKNGTYVYPSNRNLTKLNGESYRKVPTAPKTRVFTNTDRYTPNTNPNSEVNSIKVGLSNSAQNTQTNQKPQNLNKSNSKKPAKTSLNTKLLKTNNIFIKGFQNRSGEIKNVKAMLNQLIKLGLLKDRFGADGKWGKNTEAAYLKYLLYLNNPSGISISLTPNVEREVSPYELMSNNQENIPLYQRIKFKQGGQLISRNPIERFKQKIKK